MSRTYADMVTDLLRDDTTPPPRFPSDRQRLVEAVERGMRSRVRRQQLVRWSLSASAAAAVLVLVIGGKTLLSPYAPVAPLPRKDGPGAGTALFVLHSPDQRGAGAITGAVMLNVGTAPMPVAEGMPLPQGARLVAPPVGEVDMGSARGTKMALEGGGELAIREASAIQRYELKAGAIRARVAKLVTGERFIIATSDAEVEVHGTAFRVAVVPADPACGGGTITRVSVTEGVVSVRRGDAEVRIMPGQVWPESCADLTTTTAAAAGATAPSVAARSHGRGGMARAALRGPVGAAPGSEPAADSASEAPPASASEVSAPIATATFTKSELAAQNDMFASAVHAKRRGQGSQAVRIFERLAREYPNGPLAESAVVQRMKLLVAIDSVAARRAANEYLARYPGGFARIEARHIIDLP